MQSLVSMRWHTWRAYYPKLLTMVQWLVQNQHIYGGDTLITEDKFLKCMKTIRRGSQTLAAGADTLLHHKWKPLYDMFQRDVTTTTQAYSTVGILYSAHLIVSLYTAPCLCC